MLTNIEDKMITIKDFMETVNYRVTEGSEFCWSCFGAKAYRLDSWSGNQDGYTVSIVFDTESQEVYQAEVCDYAHNRAYRLTNPAYIEAHASEALTRNCDSQEAFRDDNENPVRFVELETAGDWLEKAIAIVNGKEYDTRVQIEVEFDDADLLKYMTLAHQLDITFNQLVERAIIEKINEFNTIKETV